MNKRFRDGVRGKFLGKKMKFELAPTEKIDAYEELAIDFFERVLGMSREDCLITDESSLWDFHTEKSGEEFYHKIAEVYGVDVSDVKGGNLVEIFERIEFGRRLSC